MARLTKEDWLAEGLRILSEFAQDKLRILYLCERLSVTRGSFYHHFESIEAYIADLMRAWERSNTLEIIRAADAGKTPEERMQLLNQQVGRANQSVEAAIRSWSFYHPIVREHLARVDEIRLAHLQHIFEEMGFGTEIAKRKAMLDYAMLIGLQQLQPDISAAEMEALWEVYQMK